MTLRDYFAGQALAGILSNALARQQFKEAGCDTPQGVALVCYGFATAMLAARKEKP